MGSSAITSSDETYSDSMDVSEKKILIKTFDIYKEMPPLLFCMS